MQYRRGSCFFVQAKYRIWQVKNNDRQNVLPHSNLTEPQIILHRTELFFDQ